MWTTAAAVLLVLTVLRKLRRRRRRTRLTRLPLAGLDTGVRSTYRAPVRAALNDAAAELVHIAAPWLSFVMPFVVCFFLLWWAVDYLLAAIDRKQSVEDDDFENELAFVHAHGRSRGYSGEGSAYDR